MPNGWDSAFPWFRPAYCRTEYDNQEMRLLFLALFLALSAAAADLGRVIADYNGPILEQTPRADGYIHFDTPRTIARLRQLHVNTFLYLIWTNPAEWEDLRQEFLPATQKAGIDVWIYIVPPTECLPTCSLPFGKDYVRWAVEAARLSLKFPNLKAWAIDDFTHDLDFFTPAYLQQVVDAQRAINPKMAFFPLVYWPKLKPEFVDTYAPRTDGFIMAYRDDPYRNTQVASTLNPQVEAVSAMLAKHSKPLMLMIYCSLLSDAPVLPTPAYVEELVAGGVRFLKEGKIAGIITYSLKKEERPEPDSLNHARSGHGRASLGVVSSAAIPAAGSYVEASQTVRVNEKATHQALRFWHHDRTGNRTPVGVYFAQLLIDGKVAWERQVTRENANIWKQEMVDLTTLLQGKQTAQLAFRLFSRTAGRIFDDTSIDDLEATGFTVTDPGFESPAAWKVTSNDPGCLGVIDQFDPERPLKAFEAVRRLYTALNPR